MIYSRERYLNKMIYLYSGVAGLFTMFRGDRAGGRHATLFKPLSSGRLLYYYDSGTLYVAYSHGPVLV